MVVFITHGTSGQQKYQVSDNLELEPCEVRCLWSVLWQLGLLLSGAVILVFGNHAQNSPTYTQRSPIFMRLHTFLWAHLRLARERIEYTRLGRQVSYC